jgi:hypothetical protein
MTANTILSDINEIQVGLFLNDGVWYDDVAKAACASRIKQAQSHEVLDAVSKAQVMAVEFIDWAKKNGYSGKVSEVWWTARPGALAAASKSDADSKKNPTDILVLFTSGPSGGYLGLSAKATKTKGDIGFKNPGIGTVDKALKLSMGAFYKTKEAEVIKQFKLNASAASRKNEIRSKPGIKATTEKIGQQVLADLRDILYKKLSTLENEELLRYILTDWMDADVLFPPYVKVTGKGNKAPYTADVMDPTKNEKLSAISKYPIKLEKVGNESIGVSANGKKILKMRFKFESEKMASSVKMSGDPW